LRDSAITGVLGVLWIWMGAIYHIGHFTTINGAAFAFGGLFILEGLLFIAAGRATGGLWFRVRNDVYGWTGGLFAFYALVFYPLLGSLAGHTFPAAPTFGVPCPTTIFTFAVLLWCGSRVPVWLLVIPALWSIVGLSAALALGVYEDFGLVVAGLAGTALILARNRRLRPVAATRRFDVLPEH
jgi:hypothetical protein